MVWHIIRKEILQGFLCLRFPCTLVLVTAVMLSNAVLFVGEHQEQMEDYSRNVNRNYERITRLAGGWQSIYLIFSFRHQWVYRTPNKLGFLAEGGEKDLPNAFRINAFTIVGPTKKLRGNHLLPNFRDLDWAFVVSVVMSFVAIVLTYDSISGEREDGTLRLSMSNPLSRGMMIVGKYVGAMTLLTLSFLVGVFASAVVIGASHSIHLTGNDWLRVGTMVLLSLLYISVFALLGILVSSLFRSSAASLVVLLLAWVLIVVIGPEVGSGVTTSAWKIPNPARIYPEAKAARDQAWHEYNARHPNAPKDKPGAWGYGRVLARAMTAEDARMRVYNSYWNQMVSQVRFGHNLSRISPTGIYQRTVETIAVSGLDHYESFLKQVRQYRHTLQEFALDHYPLDIHGSYGTARTGREAAKKAPELVEALSKRTFAADEIPKFRDEPVSVTASVRNPLWNVAILLLWNMVFFMAAHIAFLYRDIK